MTDNSIIKRFTNSNESWLEIAERVSSISNHSNEMKKLMQDGCFIPAGQILRGGGLKDKVLYNSFVTSIDNKETEKEIASRITQWTELGSGVGINVSDWIRYRENKSGNQLKIIAEAICKAQQTLWNKGITRTATMINVDFDIVGIEELALNISTNEALRHINLGVLMTDENLKKAEILGSSENKKLNSICNLIWSCGNPGLIFIDNVNKCHPFANEKINACNSCAEQFLLPNEGCCLGAINLEKFVITNKFSFTDLKDCIEKSISFLNNVIDASAFPCSESKIIALNRRRIGLGIMGLDTMFEKLHIDYSSREAIDLSFEISKSFREYSIYSSEEIAKKEGPFKDFNNSTLKQPRRNSYLNSIAPTGAISMIFENSSGIEPIFGNEIIKGNTKVTLRHNSGENKTIYDIAPDSQIEILSIWQKNIDGGISKTLNLTENIDLNDIFACLMLAWKKGCKGLSIYRKNSRKSAFNILLKL